MLSAAQCDHISNAMQVNLDMTQIDDIKRLLMNICIFKSNSLKKKNNFALRFELNAISENVYFWMEILIKTVEL